MDEDKQLLDEIESQVNRLHRVNNFNAEKKWIDFNHWFRYWIKEKRGE